MFFFSLVYFQLRFRASKLLAQQKINVHEMFRGGPGRLLNVVFKISLRRVPWGMHVFIKMSDHEF